MVHSAVMCGSMARLTTPTRCRGARLAVVGCLPARASAGDLVVADGWSAGEDEAVAGFVDEPGGVEVVDGVFGDGLAADVERELVQRPGALALIAEE